MTAVQSKARDETDTVEPSVISSMSRDLTWAICAEQKEGTVLTKHLSQLLFLLNWRMLMSSYPAYKEKDKTKLLLHKKWWQI